MKPVLKNKILKTLVPILLILASTLSANAAEPLTALEIMQKVDQRDDGDTSESETVMVLIDRHKNQRIRHLKMFRKDFGEDSKSIMFFLSPADVKNTSFLTYDYDEAEKDDDTWLYLPALRKVKRIASGDKSGAFMGSDFTYSDVGGLEIDQWDFKFGMKKEAIIDGQQTWVIVGKPKKNIKKKVINETGYLQTQSWVRQDNFMLVKGKFWVKKGKKIKYLTAKKIKQINGIWTAQEMKMITTKRKRVEHASILQIKNVHYNKPLKDKMFTKTRMEGGL